MMFHVPAVLSPAEVAEFRRQFDAAEWTDGRATVGEQGAQVKQNRQLPAEHLVCQRLGDAVVKALGRNQQFFSAALPLRIAPPLFNRYEGGEHYGLHVDGAIRILSGGRGHVRTDMSATLFLTEPEDYDGGELEVVDTYGTHEVKLPAGDLILYPASSLHRVTPVTRGARTSCFFWLQSMVRDDWQRGLLYELDQNIQRLRAKHGDSEEAVAITGHYHNLLRLWTEV